MRRAQIGLGEDREDRFIGLLAGYRAQTGYDPLQRYDDEALSLHREKE
jgi:hypothetical protein